MNDLECSDANLAHAIRCRSCERILAYGRMNNGSIEIKCPNCKVINCFSTEVKIVQHHDLRFELPEEYLAK